MKLNAVEKHISEDTVRLTGYVQLGNGRGELTPFFQFPREFEAFVVENADPFVAALLLPAMASGEELVIEPSVSRRLWSNLPRIQEIFSSWYPGTLKPIRVYADHFHEAGRAKDATGAFFSLGVDSFHTLLRHEKDFPGREKITHLIYMAGFELPLREFADGQERPVIDSVHEVARLWGKKAVCGWTNLRDCFPLDFPRQYHGAILAGTALALSGGMSRVLFPSSYSWRYLTIWGSHPLTDPLWSSDDLEIIHDGTGDDRTRKIIDTIIPVQNAVRYLRVCTYKRGGAGNCGFCRKCLRTMITLEIAGALESSGAFPPTLPRDFWRRLKLVGHGDLSFTDENLRLAREKNAPAWIIDGLERALYLGRLELLRKERGDLGFTADLFRLAYEKTIGRLILYPERRRKKRIKRQQKKR